MGYTLDVLAEWQSYVAEARERELMQIITEEKLKESETRRFMESAFHDGEVKTTGMDIDKLMPPVSRFGGGGVRARKKQAVIDKLKIFFERFFGLGDSDFSAKPDAHKVVGYADRLSGQPNLLVAEKRTVYGSEADNADSCQ